MELAGKVVAVTGGGNGIGKALCERFAREGAAHVAVLDLEADAAQAVADAIGGSAHAVNVRSEEAIAEARSNLNADSDSYVNVRHLATALMFSGNYAEATPYLENLWILADQRVAVASKVDAVPPGTWTFGCGCLWRVAAPESLWATTVAIT